MVKVNIVMKVHQTNSTNCTSKSVQRGVSKHHTFALENFSWCWLLQMVNKELTLRGKQTPSVCSKKFLILRWMVQMVNKEHTFAIDAT